ncbi:hypothetical protein BDW72DRAFT_205815 [Aspergillus terricola var. indicus]
MEANHLFNQAWKGLQDYEANKHREDRLEESITIAMQTARCKYVWQGQLGDLDMSIAYMQLRIDETMRRGDPRMLDHINMSVLKGDRYDVSGLADDAMSGVAFAKQAEKLAKGQKPEVGAEATAATGAALLKLCQGGIQLEESDPLDTAIAKIESAIQEMPDVNEDVIRWQHNLATLLELRFERNNRMLVLDEAIKLSETVMKAPAADKRQAAIRVNCPGNLFGRKFEWTGASEYLDNSIDRLREANSLLHKRVEDLEEAIENSRNACESGRDSPDEPISLNSLNTNLCNLYDRTKEKDCLEDAINAGLLAWELIGQQPNNPLHQTCAHNVALALTRRFKLLKNQEDFQDADAYEFQQGRVRIRLRAAQKALEILRLREDWEQARAIGSGALKLLPDLCERSLTLDNQQYAILQATGLAADLEFGRGLILRYIIDRQGDVPALKRDHPDLAAEYKTLQRQLVRMRLEAGEKLKFVVREIRPKKGFEAFLLEPKAEELNGSVADGVAVVVNVTPIRADAIIALSYSRLLSLNRPRSRKDTEKESILFVAMPTTPGQQPLSGVIEECDTVRAICTETRDCEVLNHPTAEQVCGKLASSGIIHFACHGSANETDPSQSYLLLQKDGLLDKLTVSRISSEVSHKSAWIAYLSACSTAQVKATKLADESLHIASAFQMSDFPHVIGSLWPTDDAVCVKVAEYFYTNLFNNTSALRDAVLKVQSEVVKHGLAHDPLAWAAYIHQGA